MMALFGAFMFKVRGWKQLCALLAMLGTFVAYFAMFEAFRLGSSLIVSIFLSVLVVGLYVAYVPLMVYWTIAVRARFLAGKHTIAMREAMNLPLNTEEWHFCPAFIAAAKFSWSFKLTRCLPIYRAIMMIVGFLSTFYWFDNALLVSLGASTLIYQMMAIAELARFFERAAQPSVETVLKKDSRLPILFLRSFKLDDLVVSPFNIGWRGFEYLFSGSRRTFEEYLAGGFNDIGPVIAIGRPGERAGNRPIGAAREYVDDASWQQRVLERADVAATRRHGVRRHARHEMGDPERPETGRTQANRDGPTVRRGRGSEAHTGVVRTVGHPSRRVHVSARGL
jgi:hypothetical protein